MKKLFFLSVLVGLAVTTAAFAQVGGTVTRSLPAAPKTYPTAEEFLKAEGGSCQVATDGCNTMTVENGQFGASTMMYCFAPSTGYACKKYAGQPSLDDQAKYAELRAGADGATLRAVDAFMARFERNASKMAPALKKELADQIVERAEAAIDALLDRQPQDKVLASRAYWALKLVTLEMGRVQ